MSVLGLAQPRVVAHRGAWKNTGVPQNSVASLQAAIDLKCFASECDVWMTSDSVLVVHHDPDFFGLPIEQTPYKELCVKKHTNGEVIPTLDQLLAMIAAQNHTRLVVEVKPSRIGLQRTLTVAKRAFQQVQEFGVADKVDYISFSYDACLQWKKLVPEANVAYLNGDRAPSAIKSDGLWGIDYNHARLILNPDWIPEAKKLGLTINVWTVNDENLMKRFIESDVDFITTDEPELLLRLLD